jgi:RNA polymerase sigma-70 factor (ECF subfamily)
LLNERHDRMIPAGLEGKADGHSMADSKALDRFLASVEQSGFRMARIATRNDDDAMELVQEAMTRLVRRYRHASENEWKPLFYRILENCLNDWHRQQQRQRRWFVISSPVKEEEERDESLDGVAAHTSEPDQELDLHRRQQAMIGMLESLPLQQQQCFLLRCWEGLSVKETAEAMGISEGSVKTHLHRAKQKLNQVGELHG